MLHKSFKPAKCKTSLKLAASRIKLLKNKRDVQIKQLKRELAQLLDSGQVQTARIRVEHVVREEKTMAAYDLIEIYCELIVARLPIIESQKNCPIDLKEAISSVIFASPRCADLPELMDVRKHFTVKYGKEFVSAAVELRPDCGVSRLLVEKLSVKAPDGPTKVKILSAIAEEHNVKWDPKSFGESEMKPPEDLLNGPSTFEQAYRINTQDRLNSVDKRPPDSGASSKQYENRDNAVNSYGFDSRTSQHSQTLPSTDMAPSKTMPSSSSHPDPRSFENEPQLMGSRDSYTSEESNWSRGRQGWNMEFQDAVAAARAAAESAELASFAARAAAELSSQGRMSRQPSTESRKVATFRSKDKGIQNDAGTKLQGENLDQVPANNTSHRSNSWMHLEQNSDNEQDDLEGLAERFYNLKNSSKSSRSNSSKSSGSAVDDCPQVSDLHMTGKHSRKTSCESEKNDLFSELDTKRDFSESEAEFAGELNDRMKSEDTRYFKEASIRKHSSNVSSRSHSRIPSDDQNVVRTFSQQKSAKDDVNEPSIFYEEKVQRDGNDVNSFDNHAVFFDDSGSDDDELKFGVKGENDGLDSSSYYFSEDRYRSSHLWANTSPQSPRPSRQDSLRKASAVLPNTSYLHSTSVFSEGLVSDDVPTQTDDLPHVTFDHSDVSSSDGEGERVEHKVDVNKSTETPTHDNIALSDNLEKTWDVDTRSLGSSPADKENTDSNGKTWMQPSAADPGVEVRSGQTQGTEVDVDRNLGHSYLHNKRTSGARAKSDSDSNNNDNVVSSVKEEVRTYQSPDTLKDEGPIKASSSESGHELNFGVLTGGLRNKGFRRPPYGRNASNTSSVSKQVDEDNNRIEQSSSSLDIGSGSHVQESYRRSDGELLQQALASYQEANIRKIGSEGSRKSGIRSYFDSDKSDSEEQIPKETASKTRLGSGFSRRTKNPVSSSERNSSLNSRASFQSSVDADYVTEQKSSTVSSYAGENQVKPPPQARSLFSQRSFGQGKSSEHTSSLPVLQPKSDVHGESSWKSSHPIDNRQNQPSQFSIPEYRERYQQRKSAESYKPIPAPKISSHGETSKSSTMQQHSNPSSRTVVSGGAENAKTSGSSAEPPSRDNSMNKASHVHPKLPDYETLTAHLLSLRQNRQ